MELSQLVKLALHLCTGMEYLHQNNITLNDLKTSNFFVDAVNVVKVADIGVARFQNQGGETTAETGTYGWMAPEVIIHLPSDQKADVVTFGKVLGKLVTAKVPYDTANTLQAALGVRQGPQPDIRKDTLSKLLELMQNCLDDSRSKRPSFSEIRVKLEKILQDVKRLRVKVYLLGDDLNWDDVGSGYAGVEYSEENESFLFVIDEDDNLPLLMHRISANDIYQKQNDAIISWRDPRYATDIALSFQEMTGFSYIWGLICSAQTSLRSITRNGFALEGRKQATGQYRAIVNHWNSCDSIEASSLQISKKEDIYANQALPTPPLYIKSDECVYRLSDEKPIGWWGELTMTSPVYQYKKVRRPSSDVAGIKLSLTRGDEIRAKSERNRSEAVKELWDKKGKEWFVRPTSYMLDSHHCWKGIIIPVPGENNGLVRLDQISHNHGVYSEKVVSCIIQHLGYRMKKLRSENLYLNILSKRTVYYDCNSNRIKLLYGGSLWDQHYGDILRAPEMDLKTSYADHSSMRKANNWLLGYLTLTLLEDLVNDAIGPINISKCAINFVRSCLSVDPASRIDNVLKHEFLKLHRNKEDKRNSRRKLQRRIPSFGWLLMREVEGHHIQVGKENGQGNQQEGNMAANTAEALQHDDGHYIQTEEQVQQRAEIQVGDVAEHGDIQEHGNQIEAQQHADIQVQEGDAAEDGDLIQADQQQASNIQAHQQHGNNNIQEDGAADHGNNEDGT